MTKVKDYIINWMKEYTGESGTNGYVIGVSGGIDSGVLSTLCALTGESVLILEMPIHQNEEQVTIAKKHIDWLEENFPNVTSKTVDLTETYETFKKAGVRAVEEDSKYEFTLSNTRSRLRMMTLYQFAGQLNRLVAGTGNKVEDFGIGFYTKYGDGGVDFSPLADLMKSEVYALGAELGLIPELLNSVPTDGLHDDGRTDEDQIGASYDELEWAMSFIRQSNSLNRQEKMAKEITLTARESEVLSIYKKLHNANIHKMVPIPVCNIPDDLKYSD